MNEQVKKKCKVAKASLESDLSGINLVLRDIDSDEEFKTFIFSDEGWLRIPEGMDAKEELEKVVHLLNTNEKITVDYIIQ